MVVNPEDRFLRDEALLISRYDPHGTCLANTDTDFLNDFCLGPRGRMSGSSLHYQCERVAAGYTACGNIVGVLYVFGAIIKRTCALLKAPAFQSRYTFLSFRDIPSKPT